MIRVITIEREYGSGAADIARKLAERRGCQPWDQQLTDEIARQMACDSRAAEEHAERKIALYYRLFNAFLRGSFEGTLNAPHLKMVDADCMRGVAERVVAAVAKSGNSVLGGRGSAYYRRNRPDAFHVFVYAALEAKVQRVAGKSKEEATALAETVDRDCAAYIKQYFDIEWPARHFFHLMINSILGDEMVVQTILGSIALLDKLGVIGASFTAIAYVRVSLRHQLLWRPRRQLLTLAPRHACGLGSQATHAKPLTTDKGGHFEDATFILCARWYCCIRSGSEGLNAHHISLNFRVAVIARPEVQRNRCKFIDHWHCVPVFR